MMPQVIKDKYNDRAEQAKDHHKDIAYNLKKTLQMSGKTYIQIQWTDIDIGKILNKLDEEIIWACGLDIGVVICFGAYLITVCLDSPLPTDNKDRFRETKHINLALSMSLDDNGCLFIRSNDPKISGLILSGTNHDEVLQCIGPAIRTLLEHDDKWLISKDDVILPWGQIMSRQNFEEFKEWMKVKEKANGSDQS